MRRRHCEQNLEMSGSMKILHVVCSPRGQASESYRLSQKIIGFLRKREPAAIVVNRVIGGGAIPHIDESYATALGATQQSSAESSPQRLDGPVRRADPGAGECGCRGHRNAHAQLHRTLRAEGVDRSHRPSPPDVQHDRGRIGRHAARPPGLRRRVLGRQIFRAARASAGFSHAVSEGHPGHHRTA